MREIFFYVAKGCCPVSVLMASTDSDTDATVEDAEHCIVVHEPCDHYQNDQFSAWTFRGVVTYAPTEGTLRYEDCYLAVPIGDFPAGVHVPVIAIHWMNGLIYHSAGEHFTGSWQPLLQIGCHRYALSVSVGRRDHPPAESLATLPAQPVATTGAQAACLWHYHRAFLDGDMLEFWTVSTTRGRPFEYIKISLTNGILHPFQAVADEYGDAVVEAVEVYMGLLIHAEFHPELPVVPVPSHLEEALCPWADLVQVV